MASNTYEIIAGLQGDGITYTLSAKSRTALESTFGTSARRISSVYVSRDTNEDFSQTHNAIHEQIVQLLTGMSSEQLLKHGDIRVIERPSGEVVYESAAS